MKTFKVKQGYATKTIPQTLDISVLCSTSHLNMERVFHKPPRHDQEGDLVERTYKRIYGHSGGAAEQHTQ